MGHGRAADRASRNQEVVRQRLCRRRRQHACRPRRGGRPHRRQRRRQVDADQDSRRRGAAQRAATSSSVASRCMAGTPASRATAGIETVFQDRALAVQQTIVRNIFMGREITTFAGLLDVKKERSEAERLMREIGFTSKVFSPDSIVGQLSGGERQGVAIARAIYNNADLIILDEPTTALSLTETEKVFRFVRTVRAERPLDPLHRPQHPPRLRYRRALHRARPRPGGARDHQARGPDRRPADRLHGTHRASDWPQSAGRRRRAKRSCLMADVIDKRDRLDRAGPDPALLPPQPRGASARSRSSSS